MGGVGWLVWKEGVGSEVSGGFVGVGPIVTDTGDEGCVFWVVVTREGVDVGEVGCGVGVMMARTGCLRSFRAIMFGAVSRKV